MDRYFVITGFGYAVLGMLLGIVMAASADHGQLVTHAHILLVGFVLSFIYGLCHKLWLINAPSRLAHVQFGLHNLGVLMMGSGLFLYYGKFVSIEKIDPMLAASSLCVLGALLLMLWMMLRHTKK